MLEQLGIDDIQNHFPEFKIENHIADGGQKKVYLGEYDGEQVVIKLIPTERRRSARRAKREVETMETVAADALVNLIDYFTDAINDTSVLVMVEEYIPGPTLHEVIDNGNVSAELGINVAQTLLEALQKFDEVDIVHRDIKPSNIIIAPDDRVRLLDVGIARMLTRTSITPTRASHGPGTPTYASPEQLNNNKDLQDIRSDLFSSGIVMFESLTGAHPFASDDLGLPIPDAILQNDKRPLEGYLDDQSLEQKLYPIYDKMTKPQPFQRYRQPQHALEELNDAIEGEI
ncbi:serine/threonine-protein kinase [Haloarcula sp. H-GB4]|uniref:serine/threonine protein kinase n=1 Tax=Haloarcula sp. H-GB4 TaxID=3069755 RepID=UPI0027B77EEC|nr:serine/threonine-protein kinase [Haloarcula sp. H-GB4]MDQ2073531.1 serine/threonine-protein kinase [Haloarcula sp. H-GB4]